MQLLRRRTLWVKQDGRV